MEYELGSCRTCLSGMVQIVVVCIEERGAAFGEFAVQERVVRLGASGAAIVRACACGLTWVRNIRCVLNGMMQRVMWVCGSFVRWNQRTPRQSA